MFNRSKTVLIVSFLALSTSLHAADPIKLTLDDALTVALSDNPLVKIADKEIEKSEYAKKGTYAALYPDISATGSYQRTIKKQTMYMDMGTGEAASIEIGMNNTFSGGFALSMPIIAPTLWKALQISAMDVELSIEEARSSKISMVEQVTNAFYAVLFAKDTYDVYNEVYENALYNYNIVKQKFDVGKTSEYELIRANVQVKNAEPTLYDAENAIALALWQLKALLGMDLDSDIDCDGCLKDYENEMVWQRAQMYIDDNSQIKQLEVQQRQLLKTLEMNKAENYPQLNLALNYNWNSMDNSFKFSEYYWFPYSTVGLSLTIPIFSGGKRKNAIRQTNVAIDQLALQKENAIRSIETQWYQYNNVMDVSTRQYEANIQAVVQAQKGYDIAMKRYEIGSGTQLEVSDSQVQLIQAQLSLNKSIYDFLTSKASIQALEGRDIVK